MYYGRGMGDGFSSSRECQNEEGKIDRYEEGITSELRAEYNPHP